MTTQIVNQIAAAIYGATFKMRNAAEREQTVKNIMAEKFPNVEYKFIGEKPHAGANARVKKGRDGFKINYRCGYGKHN